MVAVAEESLHEYWMRQALEQAEEGRRAGEVPVGALLVRDGALIARGWNRPIGDCDPTAHAEIVVLREAARRAGNYRLPGSTLYVTLEPCAMCAGALVQARVDAVVFGAPDPRAGAAGSVLQVLDCPSLNHRASVRGGVLEDECAGMLQVFFRERREADTPPGLA